MKNMIQQYDIQQYGYTKIGYTKIGTTTNMDIPYVGEEDEVWLRGGCMGRRDRKSVV